MRHVADPGLVDRLRAGDVGAFASLMQAHVEPLIAYVATLIESVDIAQDVVQDVFIKLWERRAHLERTQPLVPYLYRAARNKALDTQRGMRRAQSHYAAAAQADINALTVPQPDHLAEADDLSRRAGRVVSQLPAGCREIFLLVRRSGLTYQEVADILGVSTSTVKTQMGRALVALAHAVGDGADL